MQKLYNRVNWHNNTTPAINESNLNQMDKGIDDIDTRLTAIGNSMEEGAVSGVKGDAESEYRTGMVNLTKANLGLGNVDNTSDANKPVSTATQTALDGKVGTGRKVNGHTLDADVTVTASDVGLGNVDNTSDANKPVSTATQTALDGKVGTGRKVNGHTLDADVTVTASDVGAVPTTRTVNGHALSSDITVSASDVGLGNVPNVTTDNQTPTVTQASSRTNLATGDTLKTIIGKIKKFFADLGDLAFLNKDGTTGANHKYLRGDGSWQYFADNLDPYDVNCHNEVAFIAVSSANPSGEPDATLSFTLQSAEAKYIPIMYFNKSNQQDTLIKIHLGFYADGKWLGSGMLTVIGTRFMNSTYGNPNAYNLKFEGGGYINDPFKNILIGEIEQGTNAIMVGVMPATAQSIKIHYRVLHNYGIGAIEYVNTPVTYSYSDIYHLDDGVSIQNGVTTSGNVEISTDLDVEADCNVNGSITGNAVETTPTSGSSKLITSGGVYAAIAGISSGVTGVKGDAEQSYRTGQVNLTAANVGVTSLTSAQLQAVKDAFVLPTPVTPISPGLVYSTTERVVGKWLDSKPIYQKSFNVSFPQVSADEMATTDVSISDLNISAVCGSEAVASNGRSLPFTVPRVSDSVLADYYVNSTTNLIRLRSHSSDNNSLSAVVTIRYTKTTD